MLPSKGALTSDNESLEGRSCFGVPAKSGDLWFPFEDKSLPVFSLGGDSVLRLPLGAL